MGVLEYLLIGLVIGFLIESISEATGVYYTFWERIALWLFWPIMVLVFIFYFIKGMMSNE